MAANTRGNLRLWVVRVAEAYSVRMLTFGSVGATQERQKQARSEIE
ncbi:hypothetical protein IQ255_18025 [Pleurocapsales cyanobacterium LEGE 10410]|nr:hypothetical protein [Pleurocapsales cyanobacterium LEGE 10410]